MNLTRGINLTKIAEKMGGASGAEVKGVCTEAGMYALRERRVHVTQEDFEMAVSKVTVLFMIGNEEGCGAKHEYQKVVQINLSFTILQLLKINLKTLKSSCAKMMQFIKTTLPLQPPSTR
jgi:hypothetical protein